MQKEKRVTVVLFGKRVDRKKKKGKEAASVLFAVREKREK